MLTIAKFSHAHCLSFKQQIGGVKEMGLTAKFQILMGVKRGIYKKRKVEYSLYNT